jgi:signal transduction histidine kinase
VQATLFFALLANFASTYLIHLQQRGLSALPEDPDAVPTNVLESLRQDVQLQFTTSVVLSAILVCCVVAMWWLRRRYLSSQRSLRQIKMLAHDILASMDRGVVTTNRQGLITSINSTAIRLLEVDFECVGRPIASVSTAAIPLVDVYREVVEGQMTVLDRDFTVDRSGRVSRLRIDGHVLKDAEERALGCVVHLRDVTERMLLEERMRRMERFLSLATLASGLHHEIKNPLTALSIHIQLLEEQLADRPATTQLVDVLKTEVARLNGVLESFRSFAHLQRLSFQTTDVFGVLEGAVRLMRPQAAQQRVQITLLYPEGELPRVPLDVEKFEQAVLNLVINALEAMPNGGTLTISATVVDGEFRVSVKDSGPGIPPHVQRNLFLPYFSTKATGSGMGLALSEKVISQHGGRIDFRTGSEGTTFDVTVPLEQRNGAT